MASFQIGSEIAAPLSLTAPFPVDARNVANSVEQVLTEYPSSCRYLGMRIWIESENKLYVFSKHVVDGVESTGLEDSDFQPFESNRTIEVDSVLSDTSTNPVQNKIVKINLDLKQPKLVVDENLDSLPTQDSENPITSGAVYHALEGVRGQLNYKGFYATIDEMNAVTDAIMNDWCTVANDDDHDNQKSKYIYDGTQWIYNGQVSEANVSIDDENISSSTVWSSDKTYNELEKQHQKYESGIPLVAGEYYVESHALYKCLQDIAAEDNSSFALLPENTMELIIGNGEIKQCEYDEPSETLFLNRLTTDMIEYSEDTETLTIFEQ